MTTKIKVKMSGLELEVESETDILARKLMDDLSDKFDTVATRKSKKLA